MKMMENKLFRPLIVDTNILQHLGNIELGTQIIDRLRLALSKNYIISYSEYSILEMVDCASVEKEQKRLNAIDWLIPYPVDKQTLIVAGHLGGLLQEDGLSEKQQPEKGDKIIGATSIIQNAIIYTTNGKDFPQPYFKEYSRHMLIFTKDKTQVCIMAYIIEPDRIAIRDRYNYRVKHSPKYQSMLAPANLISNI